MKTNKQENESPIYGYHIKEIKKGTLGEIGKIIEECEEYLDAKDQNCEIMMLLELSDIYGALELLVETHNISMEQIILMNKITKRAFLSGKRK